MALPKKTRNHTGPKSNKQQLLKHLFQIFQIQSQLLLIKTPKPPHALNQPHKNP